MKSIKFPQDFDVKPHQLGSGLQYTFSDNGEVKISIVVGKLFYSNGVDTFEMWDYREDEPQGYLTIDEINEHLQNKPF